MPKGKGYFIEIEDLLADLINWLEKEGKLKEPATQDLLTRFLKEKDLI